MANFKTRMGWDNAKHRGRDDFRAGKVLSDNPYYRGGDCSHWWNAGWWEEENAAAIRENRPVRVIDGACTLIGDNIRRQAEFEMKGEVEKL